MVLESLENPIQNLNSNLVFKDAKQYATTTFHIVEHHQENMAKPEGLKHTK